VQGEAAGRAREPGGNGDEPGPHGGGGRDRQPFARACGGEGAGCAQQVERDRREGEPGGDGGEHPRRQMRQRPCLEVGDDLLDDGVRAVRGFGLEHGLGGVGEDRVVSPGREQLLLALGDLPAGGVGVESLDVYSISLIQMCALPDNSLVYYLTDPLNDIVHIAPKRPSTESHRIPPRERLERGRKICL
jgi:hypothetical protein